MTSTNTSTTRRTLQQIVPRTGGHWVGDGFPVQSVLSPRVVGDRLSPFILFDYAAPRHFEPSTRPRGVDTHPHRGFETVTIVYQGELEHRDSAGNSGSLVPGDVQWMTAASGILHEEKHSARFTRKGGMLEMAQLWVNLPARDKMSTPRYQELTSANIPVVQLPADAGTLRVIAGDLGDTSAAARTVTPVLLWDAMLRAGKSAQLPIPTGHNAGIFVRTGSVAIDGQQLTAGALGLLTQDGDTLVVHADTDAQFILLGGQPINEPVVAYGPFVMNTSAEIQQAMADYQEGKFGRLVAV
jgi:redox-sensitive bicupin YhaK (pirin superfamily)